MSIGTKDGELEGDCVLIRTLEGAEDGELVVLVGTGESGLSDGAVVVRPISR